MTLPNATRNASVNVVILILFRDFAGYVNTVITGHWGDMHQWLLMWAGISKVIGPNPKKDDL